MPKLNQILAIESGVKKTTAESETNIYHLLQKADLQEGLYRSYTPKDDEGDPLPAEAKNIQVTVDTLVSELTKTLTKLFDITATKDFANQEASADIVIDGSTLINDAPVTYLLWLDKRLTDLHTVAKKIPVLAPTETWTYDSALGYYKTAPIETIKTKKVLKNHVKSEATKEHPAQVDTYAEDVQIGTWSAIKASGAWPSDKVKRLVARIEILQAAVKFARESANETEAPEINAGDVLFGYLLG